MATECQCQVTVQGCTHCGWKLKHLECQETFLLLNFSMFVRSRLACSK